MFPVFLALMILHCSLAAASTPPIVGGSCEYKHYKGTAEVVSVTLIGSGEETLQDEYEVKCVFHPREEIKEQFAQATTKEFLLFGHNGQNPRRHFIEQHGIRVGKQIECVLKVIIRGTCTPVMFEFPWADK
jgi:hypothetical protein